MNIPSKLFN